jgi:hypothetical protein
MMDWVRELAARWRGTWWRWAAARPGAASRHGGDNPTEACGLQYEDDRPGGLLGADFRSRQRAAGHQHRRLPHAPQLGDRHPDGAGRWQLHGAGPGPTQPAALLRRPAGAPRLHAQRVLRIQGQRREAVRPGLHDGAHGLQGHPGACRLQHPAVERRGQLHARRLCLHCLHRAGLSGARATRSTKRPSWRAFPSACPPTCPRPGLWRWRPCQKAPRPKRVKHNAVADHLVVKPAVRKTRLK